MRKLVSILALVLAGSSCGWNVSAGPITLGAVYPLHGGQGDGGTEEYRGTSLAVEYANAHGGVGGRPVQLAFHEADDSDAAPRAVADLADSGVPVIIGTHGSTISAPAATAATKRGVVFWETGAIGVLPMLAASGDRVFRFVPTGESLGRAAVAFARDVLLPKMRRAPSSLRWGVTYVNDPYGSSVGMGAIAEVRRAGLNLAGDFPYELKKGEDVRVAHLIKAARIDVLFVSAYMDDGVALRKEVVRERIPMVASVGTSSSYCMEQFGKELGKDSLGLFASDKPDGQVIDATRLTKDGAAALQWARAQFSSRYHETMSAYALSGFSGTWALLHDVLPRAADMTPDAIARAARTADVPTGALPNGSGLKFEGSENVRATSVIWEWIKPGVRAVVWPPAFARHAVVPMAI
jgi:branched-chain amino acid transport system substrate-binding protein